MIPVIWYMINENYSLSGDETRKSLLVKNNFTTCRRSQCLLWMIYRLYVSCSMLFLSENKCRYACIYIFIRTQVKYASSNIFVNVCMRFPNREAPHRIINHKSSNKFIMAPYDVTSSWKFVHVITDWQQKNFSKPKRSVMKSNLQCTPKSQL